MAKLAIILAFSNFMFLHALPTREMKRSPVIIDEREITLSTDLEATTSYSSALVSSLQIVTATVEPSITGSILTGLPSGGFTRDPLNTPTFIEPTESITPIQSTLAPGPTKPTGDVAGNIFVPIATNAPPQQIQQRNDHIVKKDHIVDGETPIETNKFYANFFLGSQTNPVWTHPYSLFWAKGRGNTYGMAISHIEREQLAWDQENDPPQYFIGPVGLQHIVFSAVELGERTTLSTESLTAFSVFANLAPSPDAEPLISIPCVQGMGFVTALYNNAQPILNSGTFFRTVKYAGAVNGITYKYQITLEDSSEWLLYITPVASLGAPPFELVDSQRIQGPENFIGMIQVAKNPSKAAGEAVYDSAAGAYATNATISGSSNGPSGSYTIEWGKDGVKDQTLIMYTLPHHVESFDDTTSAALTEIELATTTKGYARALVADKITMIENDLPDTLGFAPWIQAGNGGSGGMGNENLGTAALAAVNKAGILELSQDIDRQTRLDSMYYSGKGLAKFAGIVYTLQTMAKNTQLAAAGLVKLKDAFNVFVNNTQPLPLVYDTVWKGIVSSGTYQNGDPGLDFGNTLYNDHHFHYGYFVWAAAVIGYLDPIWLEEGTNKAWINTLIRDYANPSTNDPYFPFQRSFDWYHGHSWAKGLFESGDGKDQESSSEDTFATYAIKMWGKTSGDVNMEARGNLQLAVQARSVRNYFLLSSNNKVQPEQFLGNKVTGILFENKVDHTTYFGANSEYIQGIHMIPLNPSSAYTRPKNFVKEEWDTYFSGGRVDQVVGGWKGILYANLALIDPITAYSFFSDPNFDMGILDGGASWTWYLAYSAAMGGGGGAPVASAEFSNEHTSPVDTETTRKGELLDIGERSSNVETWEENCSDVEERDSDEETWEDYYSDVEERGWDEESKDGEYEHAAKTDNYD